MDTRMARAIMLEAVHAFTADKADLAGTPPGDHELSATIEAWVDGVKVHAPFHVRAKVSGPRHRREAIPVNPVDVAAWLLAKIPKAKRDRLLASLPDRVDVSADFAPDARKIINIFRKRERRVYPPAVTLAECPYNKPRK